MTYCKLRRNGGHGTTTKPKPNPRIAYAERRVKPLARLRQTLGQRVRIAAELRLGAAELRELNRIGVNLNQMARALNSGAVSSPVETQAAVERVGELVAKLLAGERE